MSHGISLSLGLEFQEREVGVMVEVRVELKLELQKRCDGCSWHPPQVALRLRIQHVSWYGIGLRLKGQEI